MNNNQFSIHRYPNKTRQLLKNGTYQYYKNSTTIKYQFRIKHPSEAELDDIRGHIAAGMSIKAAAAKFDIGCQQRLSKLLKQSQQRKSKILTDDELDDLINNLYS